MYATIAAAFDTALQAFPLAGMDLVLEGQSYTPNEQTGYVQSKLAAYTRTALGFGRDSVLQEAGSYQVSVNRPTSEGRDYAGALADQVAALFPRGLQLVTSDNQLVTVEVASVMPAIISGAWITVPVTVSWISTNP